MMQKLVVLAGALVVVLVMIVVIVFMSIDSIAKTAIVRGSTYALGVQTTLGSADIGIFSGEFAMKGLNVANPDGFESEYFLQLGEGFLAVSLGSLRQDTVEVPTLALTGIDINLEKRSGKANYKIITDNLKRFESTDSGDDDAKADAGKPDKKFVVHEIIIRDVNVKVDFGLTRMEIPIEEVRMTEVGTESMTTAELTNRVIKMILAAIVKNGAQLPADLVNDLGGALAELGGLGDMTVSETVKTVGKVLDGLDKGSPDAGKSIGDAIEGLGGLFGDKK
jgi:hypothetical protein